MNGSARFSPEPNPRWVAYTSDESGRYEIYVQSFPEPKRKWQISMGGGMFPEWGAGGQELFYLAPNGKLMSVKLKVGADSVEPSAPRELFSVAGSGYQVAPDGKRFPGARAQGERSAAAASHTELAGAAEETYATGIITTWLGLGHRPMEPIRTTLPY